MKKLISLIIMSNLMACSAMQDFSSESEASYGHESYNDPQESVVQEEQVEAEALLVVEEEEALPSRIDNEPVSNAGPASIEFQSDYRQHLLTKMDNMGRKAPSRAIRHKDINFYVRGLMQDLVSNMKYVNATTPMAVTSFVMLDSDYQYADILGKQLSESFVHEVHKFGIPVIDFKTTDFIRVSPDGDFIFSKDYLELEGDLPIKYALAGTLTKHMTGYLVNARIVGIESKAVVASAQGFLPNNVVNRLVASGFNDGIPLKAASDVE